MRCQKSRENSQDIEGIRNTTNVATFVKEFTAVLQYLLNFYKLLEYLRHLYVSFGEVGQNLMTYLELKVQAK